MPDPLSKIPRADYQDIPPLDPNQPVGLRAAVDERLGAAERASSADAAAGADGFGPEPQPAELAPGVVNAWRPAVELVLGMLDGWMGKWVPEFKPPAGPSREAGVVAWSAWLSTVASAPTPLQAALAWTIGSYGAPAYIGWKQRQVAAREADPRG